MTYTYFVSYVRTDGWGTSFGNCLMETNYKINKLTWKNFLSKVEKLFDREIAVISIQLLEETPE